MRIKPILRRILPKFVIDLWHLPAVLRKRMVIFTWESVCDKKIATIKDKEVLTVLFLPANVAMWKYDSLFKRMMAHPRFRPLILPSPAVVPNKSEQEKEVEMMTKYFEEKGFPVIDEQGAKTVSPDIVFLTQGFDLFRYGLKSFPRALGCYSPYYAFPSIFEKRAMDLLDLNKAWRIFTQNKASYDGTIATMTNKGKNVRISGYLNADRFLQKDVPLSFSWKSKNPVLKKVIYAPHWTIDPSLSFAHSTFLSMGEIMLELAEKYADKIQWCFTTHPWLLRELKKLPEWGEERARAYFKRWEELENATYYKGEYISLFMTSDAMIHDCSSFRFEYFYTQKPVMYLMQKGQDFPTNDVTLKAINDHYHGYSREDVERFLEEVVLGENDPKADERERFLREYLLPPNNQSVAQNIIDEIEHGLGWRS